MAPLFSAPSARRGMNLGNALDAPADAAHALAPRERYLDAIRDAGFDTVRLPVAWSAHAAPTAPYTVRRAFAERVDRAVDAALARGLTTIVNVHHYHELHEDPEAHAERFLALWRQIAPRYADRDPALLHFELLNEPRAALTPERWNVLLARALAVVRESNPDRTVLVGPAEMNDLRALPRLELPDDDHLTATIHYYAPFPFTHQGAHWVEGSAPWLGTSWGADADRGDADRVAAERAAVSDDLAEAAAWAKAHGVPLFLGEFGAYERADLDSRARWTAHVRREAERLGIGWAYWEFGTDFGAFDPATDTWREPLRRALVPDGR
ncbi:glycoside hydrolase family 5 protein [Streptomyces sp. 4N509B]|uniref:glycoside hydrolase family 5 protein n=1 Tax=Streptomyces sp. 4N509B TaxID=3457413 RepID=UPI003FD03D0A